MARRPGVPVRQRRVSRELRELRKRVRLTCADVAEALDVSVTKISRMETGERGLYVDDVSALLGLYRVPAKRREELLDLVRNCADRNWWQPWMGKLSGELQDLIEFESDAVALHNFEPLIVPGLLQTAEYIRAFAYGADEGLSEVEVDMLIAARMARQALLSRRDAPTLHVIVDEAVLRRPVGEPGVMQRQLRYLVDAASRPNITLQVVPFAAGAHTGMQGPFLILDFADQPTLVYLETQRTSAFLGEEEHIRATRLALRRLHTVALAPEDSVRLIASITGELI